MISLYPYLVYFSYKLVFVMSIKLGYTLFDSVSICGEIAIVI